MRAGLATIQQTLTTEAAAVLNRAIAEASRRRHGQTTPLHVAATLLAAPSGLLRQACARSHPLSSHPLQCRALELCFSVALDRLPASSGADPVPDPPLSNALMAALKRAQAHQRRGCPEQQQPPLLAVKVELEQLVVSILDDPSVSRVMREASFSSPAVKAAIEQSLASLSPVANFPSSAATPAGLGLSPGPRPPSRNLYVSPRLQQQQQQPQRRGEVKKVLEILTRTNKHNPVLVGDSDPDAAKREVLLMIERRELGSHALPALQLAHVVTLEREFSSSDRSLIPSKIRELGGLVESRIQASAINGGGGVILDLGDLKWLVEGPGGYGESVSSGPIQLQQRQVVSEIGREVVAEMGRLLQRFGEGSSNGGRLWVVGTATCATYLRCQVYFPSMEVEWDLQAVPVAPRSPLTGLFPRFGGNGILSSSVESLSPLKGFQPMSLERTNSSHQISLCKLCRENYERELAKLGASEVEKSSTESRPESRQALPHWLQLGTPSCTKPTSDQPQTRAQELRWKQRTEELLNKWRMTCVRLHRNSHPPAASSEKPLAPTFPLLSANTPSVRPQQTFQTGSTLSPRSIAPVQMSRDHGLQINSSSERPMSPPGSPVKTDLVLGQSKALGNSLEKTHRERVKGFPGCMQGPIPDQPRDKTVGNSETDSLKRLFKGLMESTEWQPEAASSVASTVMQCRSGNGKRRGLGPKADTWLLFLGPDKVGKRKMAYALSELLYGTGPITIGLGSPRTEGGDGESNAKLRGKTAPDRLAEAIQRNPFAVFVLEDIDYADTLARGTIQRAIERGRLPDSYGREVSLGGGIFLLTSNWLPEELKRSQDFLLRCEEKVLDSVNSGRQLEFSPGEKTGKRRADWSLKDERNTKARKESAGLVLSLDLNLGVGIDDDACEGSRNSSDLTVEHENEAERLAVRCSTPSNATELMELVDNAIVFKPVDFSPMRRRISESITKKFREIMGDGRSMQVDEDALDQLVGGVWLGGATTAAFEEWAERVLVPSIQQLKNSSNDGATVRLSSVKTGARMQRGNAAGDLLPSSVMVNVDGL
ncbi:protein SUPPRESSOR OF MAX2 1-like [Phoenix dactylifera]|uniref:Protein SUPPRESSOR OF MAX2 1-like n=1 Tax=Phoenix dactylifera TaxID=42345 RepID=A0A8B8ZNU6_PHODC|nr:protein SUPPRESSOR OF MAX2 1-like [Phoenix dactylifera]